MMDVLGGLIVMLALALLLLGLAVVIRPISRLGFSQRWHGLLLFAGGIVLVLAAQEVSPTMKRAANALFGAKRGLTTNSTACSTDPGTGGTECKSDSSSW
jgi:hypothetical protein